MKQLVLVSFFLHLHSEAPLIKAHYPTIDLMTVRTDPWIINLQRVIYYTDTCYAVQFRDQSVLNAVIVKTLDLETLEQLKYFRKGLVTLKKGNNGDVAELRQYSIKNIDTKKIHGISLVAMAL
jgi:hypothetical protein